MKRIYTIGLCLMAIFAMSAMAAGSASAHEWLIGGNPIAAETKIHSLFLLLLADTKATGGEVKVHCHGFDSGDVGPGALDLVLTVTTELLKGSDKIPCTYDVQGQCSGTPTLLALHLPWHTSIVEIGTEVRDLILSDGNGAPGWGVTCNTLLGETTDICEEEPGKMGTTALKDVSEGVVAIFDSKTLHAKCSVGGKEAGVVTGTDLNFSPGPGASEKLTFD